MSHDVSLPDGSPPLHVLRQSELTLQDGISKPFVDGDTLVILEWGDPNPGPTNSNGSVFDLVTGEKTFSFLCADEYTEQVCEYVP